MQAEEQTQTSTKVKALGELLEYQDSSIVSRVLLKNSGGTVTGFNSRNVSNRRLPGSEAGRSHK